MKKTANPNHGWQTAAKEQRTIQRTGRLSGTCGECVHFPICSLPGAKSATPENDYCLWGTDKNFYQVIETPPAGPDLSQVPDVAAQKRQNQEFNRKLKGAKQAG